MKINKRRLSLSIIVFLLLMLGMTLMKDKIEEVIGKGEKKLVSIRSIKPKLDSFTDGKGYENSVIIDKGVEIVSYGLDGLKQWSRSINPESEKVSLGEEGIHIVDKEKGSIYKLDLEGEKVWSYDVDNYIHTVIENEGYLFVYSKVDNDLKNITVLNKAGEEVLDKNRSKEEILSSNVSKHKNNFIIISMDNKSADIKSKLTYINKHGDVIWEKDFDDKIIYNVFFLKNNNMILIEDKELMCINSEGEVLWSRQVDLSLKSIEVSDDNRIFMLYGEKKSLLEILDSDGKAEYKKSFNKLYDKLYIQGKDVILAGKDEILGLNNDKINLKYNIKDEVKHIDKFNNKLFIFKEDKIDIFKIEKQ